MFFKVKKNKQNVELIYSKVVAISRNRTFYTKLSVPDTLDGRFDMLLLFIILMVNRLSKNKEGKILAQKLFDRFFLDLDYSLRELGAGDVGVALKIKDMSSAYLGRQSVYIKSFKEMNIDKLCENLNNNIYRNAFVKKEILISLAQFCFTTRQYLDKIEDHNIFLGQFEFPKLNI